MNLKVRVAIFFTFFVALILFISTSTIYVLYKNYRKDDFYMRIKSHCTSIITDYKEQKDDSTILVLKRSTVRTLYNEQVLLIDNAKKVIYQETDTVKINIHSIDFDKIKNQKEVRFELDNAECLGIYNEELGFYIIGSAIDRTGFRKLKNLSFILISVLAGGVLISALFSFFVVQQAFRPLSRLNLQIQQTTATNMTTKVDEGNGKDEIQQIAKNFNAMLDRLIVSFENQKSFVRHASHELRTPLTTMLAQTDAALNQALSSEEYKKILISLQEEQTELIELTNSLLILSQYEQIDTSISLPNLRIDELLYESIEECQRFYSSIALSIEFENEPNDESELIISGNDVLIKSAFRNLIKNAYLYSTDKRVNIFIKTSINEVCITFINKGAILKKDEIEKMYIPFFRGDNANSIKGYGLGMSIIKRVVEIHNGKLVYSPIGLDTNKFAIYFTKK
jgi:signal transduction histidine kinase